MILGLAILKSLVNVQMIFFLAYIIMPLLFNETWDFRLKYRDGKCIKKVLFPLATQNVTSTHHSCNLGAPPRLKHTHLKVRRLKGTTSLKLNQWCVCWEEGSLCMNEANTFFLIRSLPQRHEALYLLLTQDASLCSPLPAEWISAWKTEQGQ